MDQAEARKYEDLMDYLDSVDGQLSNIKGRVKGAIKIALAKYKAFPDDQPTWKPMAAALKELEKAQKSASKSVGELNKLGKSVADEKKRGALTMDSVKTTTRKHYDKVIAVERIYMKIQKLELKLNKEEITLLNRLDPDTAMVIMRYRKDFLAYHKKFKVELNKL